MRSPIVLSSESRHEPPQVATLMLPPCARAGSVAPAKAAAPASSVRRFSVHLLMLPLLRLQRLLGTIDVAFREAREAERFEIERRPSVDDPLGELLADRRTEREAVSA